ncbi:hypothetical protein ACTWPB_17550 [Nocardia sp. IBHARD005]|uniref:hypothetical protein n=1 Tax=Nocardia sp. IBHARD005 TaxID=3457765 RepID=UPI00405983A0
MTEHASVVRDGTGLAAALERIDAATSIVPMLDTVEDSVTAAPHLRRIEDAALTLTARALLRTAAARAESRGCHTRSEYPGTVDQQRYSTAVRLDVHGGLELTTAAIDFEPVPVGMR